MAMSNQLIAGVQGPPVPPIITPPLTTEMDHNMSSSSATTIKGSPFGEQNPFGEQVPSADKMDMGVSQGPTPDHSLLNEDQLPSSPSKFGIMSDFLHIDNFESPGPSFTDSFWQQTYSLAMGPDMYANPLPIRSDMPIRPDMPMPTAFPGYRDMSTGAESMPVASPRASIHTRDASIPSTGEFDPMKLSISTSGGIPEYEVVIAADDAWPLARCNRPTFTASCPRTAIVHLEALEQKCKQESTWDALETFLTQCQKAEAARPTVIPIASRTRDTMTAITQSFLQKALGVHRGGASGYSTSNYSSPGRAFNFIMLPPNEILEYFLGSYVHSLADYYPLAHAMLIDPNEMVQNTQASTLLVLLMIAQGAAAVPLAEARYLSAGLTETSRISLFGIIEKDVQLSADPVALRCALLLTHLGVWSGDKWQMDIAMGQRGMYLSVSSCARSHSYTYTHTCTHAC